MGREGGAQETELAPATGTGPWLTKVRKTIDGTGAHGRLSECGGVVANGLDALFYKKDTANRTPEHRSPRCTSTGVMAIGEPVATYVKTNVGFAQ